MSNVKFTNKKIEIPAPGRDYDCYHIPEGFNVNTQNNIESGYFVFTMMPSLRCELNCPHCYLSTEERRNSPVMSLEQLKEVMDKVYEYYSNKPDIPVKFLSFYWYGGEPTQMGIDYMIAAFKMIEERFTKEDGYHIRHTLLTSLIAVQEYWFEFFEKWCGGYFQTSFDGLMRGKRYVRDWEQKVKKAKERGISVGTITVVNNKILEDTPKGVLDYLVELGISEASFLPMMRNEQNEAHHYGKFAPTMDQYSQFMIEFMEYWYELKDQGVEVPAIGQSQYIMSRSNTDKNGNIAGQTMFLMPNGDFTLPDYKNGYTEFMLPFGNIFESNFEDVLSSKERRKYLRKQYFANKNSECIDCDKRHQCIMEFWKDNKQNDDCFGAKKYVDWLVDRENKIPVVSLSQGVMC